MSTSIAILGEFSADNPTHVATNEAIRHAAAKVGAEFAACWIDTDELGHSGVEERLKDFDAVWIAPGSPYKNMEAVLRAIRFAREKNIPLLGTCGGFQHIVLEYARNVLGFVDADHGESNPYASVLFISRLACSLAGRSMTISFQPDSLVARAYGKATVEERYYCNFGVNPDYVEVLRGSGLRIVAADEEGQVRAVELSGHRFFVGTLFIPQTNSSEGNPHPLVAAFLRAAVGSAKSGKSKVNVDRIETERLVGRRVQPDDFELTCRILQDPQVAATLGGVRSDDEVRDFLARNLKQWEQHGYGRWMWHSKADGRFVGRGGLLNIELEGREQVEVGYAIVPEFWNQGLATEITRASIQVAFEELDMPILVCFTMPTNLASRRVMEKAGFIYERDFVWQNVPHVLFWLKR